MILNSEAVGIWGRTFAATGGTMGFLLFLWIFYLSSGLSNLTNETYPELLAIGALSAVVGSVVPRLGNRFKAAIIFSGWILTTIGLSSYVTNVSLQNAVEFFYSWSGLILVGGTLTFLGKDLGKVRPGNQKK